MNYYGITIGPIVETISQASTPASLWYASYMFSELTRELCEQILGRSRKSVLWKNRISIISPAIRNKEEENEYCIGIGMYPDRILLAVDESERMFENEIKSIISNIKSLSLDSFIYKVASDCCFTNEKTKDSEKKRQMKEVVMETTRYLMDYIQIHFVCLEENNEKIRDYGVVLALNYYLDVLELQKPIITTFVTKPFQQLFYSSDYQGNGQESSNNRRIKDSHFFKDIVKNNYKYFSLVDVSENTVKIRQLSDVANPENGILKEEWKKFHYYALVQADGDNMGKYLAKQREINEIQKFSQLCLKYTTKSVELIQKQKGTIIYAGGDDLLFLVPVQQNREQNVFRLIEDINQIFLNVFGDINKEIMQEKLALSFGVSIANTKFPLYENLKKARMLLFGVAKQSEGKNSVAISLRKGNCKEMETCIKLSSFSGKDDVDSVWRKFLELISTHFSVELNQEKEKCKQEMVFSSVVNKIETWYAMFEEADSDTLDYLFQNLFQDIKECAEVYLEDVKELMKQVFINSNTTHKENVMSDEIKCILTLLQIGKFLTEKATRGVDYE